MSKTLKKLSFKSVLPRVIALVLAAVVLLGVTGFGVFRMIAGAKPVSSSSKPGDYVSFDLSQTVVGYASISRGDTLRCTYYILDLGDGGFATLSVAPKDDDLLDPALDQSEQYYHDHTLDSLLLMGRGLGTVKTIIPEEQALLVDALEDAELEGSPVPILIRMNRSAVLSRTWTVILSVCALILLLLAALQLVLVFTGFYQKKALAAAAVHCSAEEAEADFNAAQVFDHVRVGDQLIWFQNGAKTNCVATESAVWAFDRLDSRMIGARLYSLDLYLRNGGMCDIRTRTEGERKRIAEAIAAKGHPFVYGYTQDRAHRFATDREGFIRDLK